MAAVKHILELFVLFAFLFFILLSLIGFVTSIKPQKFISKTTPEDLGLEYEEVTFTTKEGIKLRGWFIPNQNEQSKTIILLHGYPADKGDILPVMSFLGKKFNLFLFDFRYLGESGGSISTAGAKETEDLLAAIGYLKSRNIDEVGIWGFSMGGAVALMTARDAPEIKAVISESSYARLDLMARELYRIPLLKYPLSYLTGFWSKIFLGVHPKDVSPVEGVKKLDIPILLLHSKNDQVVPFKHALLLQEALIENPRANFWFEDNLVHGQLGNEYQNRILEFFEKNLGYSRE
jgi:dipeptidyl aminopeptidase/acylaminoacyl peptidase